MKIKRNSKAVRDFTAVEVRDAGDDSAAAVHASISSEAPYMRVMWDKDARRYVDGYEVLGHTPEEIVDTRMREGLVIQDTHGGDQIGIIDHPELKDGKLGGVIRFGSSQRAQEIKADAIAGIRKNMSVGYMVLDYKKDGVAEDGCPIFRVTKWMPYEASFVNVPADTNVGVGRSADDEPGPEDEAPEAEKDEEETPPAAAEEDKPEEPEIKSAAVEVAIKQEEPAMEPKEMAALIKQASRAGIEDKVVAGIGEGKTEAELRGMVADAAFDMVDKARAEVAQRAEVFGGEAAKEVAKRGYSLMNVIRSQAGDRSVDVGLEREVSDELAKATGKSARGFYVPTGAFVRDTTATTTPAFGSNTIETSLLASEYAEALLGQSVIYQAGVRTMTGLRGDIAIPKGSELTTEWVGEDAAATQTNPVFSQVVGTPKTATGNLEITRKLIQQSSLDVENLLKEDLLRTIAAAVEKAAFAGTGAANDPTGIEHTDGVQAATLTAGAVTMKEVLDMEAMIRAANVDGDLAFVMGPYVKSLLASTAISVGSTAFNFLMAGDELLGHKALVSTLCTSGNLYLGKWAEMIIGMWGGVDVIVDPYTSSTKGNVRISAFQDVDVIIRRPEAFAFGAAIATA